MLELKLDLVVARLLTMQLDVSLQLPHAAPSCSSLKQLHNRFTRYMCLIQNKPAAVVGHKHGLLPVANIRFLESYHHVLHMFLSRRYSAAASDRHHLSLTKIRKQTFDLCHSPAPFPVNQYLTTDVHDIRALYWQELCSDTSRSSR